ncbi:glycoside hydrolase family 18 protein [Jeotgalibacillus sp. R-1-5s-1]|uniref:glycoside hydrolase family 18 protein n=1 Tax=Jeotgalibacillus sp. R-1-5s-1 TaxID=2555897 RepID=UPI001068E854|nr:glycoside hydrolase family 18 protein [Jeotgalibacillus sp. R-1-5s-1]TFD96288.1 LysM peptidoglycan-binding domain-containing protein [Jeotgalibacillus sp. R-1-5s-1]
MQIHIVQPGETLFTIGARYSITPQQIATANQLPNPDRLVVGQALVIPITGSYYFVQPGDSLYQIARRNGLTYQELAAINGLSPDQPLAVGWRLYLPPAPKASAEFNAYAEPFGAVSENLLNRTREAAPYLTYLAPFSFQAKRDGTLSELIVEPFVPIAEQNRVTLMMVITNLEEGAFSDELGRILLNDQAVQDRLLDSITATAKQYGFRDIHFDFEYLRPADEEAYTAFLRKAKDRFSKEGWLVSAALAPKTRADQPGKWYEAHNYKAIGEIVDFVVIMTYEWGYSGGPAQAVSPIGPVRDVLEYALTEMPASKIMMGQNLYGYDWTLPFVQGSQARAISPQEAIAIAARQGVPIQYDETAQAPFIEYTAEGKDHIIWFEDARSIQAKFDLLKELRLRGMSYWKLGLSFPQNWLLISDQFNVVKLP